MKILFVCTGNTCRSPMAEYYFKKLIKEKKLENIEVDSAGTLPVEDESIYGPVKNILNNLGLDAGTHIPKIVSRKLIEKNDLILTMELFHKNFVTNNFPEYKEKVHVITEYTDNDISGIPDPFGGSIDVYGFTLSRIGDSINKIIERI